MSKENFYNLDTLENGIERNLGPGIDTTVFPGEQAMVSVVRVAPGAHGQIHHHAEEQWGICRSGSGIRIQGGERVSIKAGDFWCTPGGVPHGIEAGDEGLVVVDIFAPPRGAYKTAGSGFAAGDE